MKRKLANDPEVLSQKILEEDKKEQAQVDTKKRIGLCINHWGVQLIMLFITVYALIGDDIRLLSTDKDADVVFTVFNILCLIAFTVELILSSIGVKDYFGSFFFWLDLISTISIVLDIEPIANGLLNQG